MPVRTIPDLLKGKQGLRVVGDVHGHRDALATLVAEAREHAFAVLLLGDIVDRGPDSVGAMRVVLDLLETGDGELVVGNHDDKIRRWIIGSPVEVSQSGLGGTIAQIEKAHNGIDVARAFGNAIAERPLWRRAGRFFFVHASFAPDMLHHRPAPAAHERSRFSKLASAALYGETDGTFDERGRPTRTYRWVDAIPSGMTVFIGHDVVSLSEIVTREGARGGRVVHLDTGIDRGGKLSSIDLKPDELFS
jgi:protein phosphatase